ncbi:ACT domain-containing protein [soil metagenome]
MQEQKFIILPGNYSLCRLAANEQIPVWVFTSLFYTISKSPEELSIVCESKYVPGNIQQSNGWKLLKIDAVLDLSLTGITAKFSKPLAEAGVNLCVIATFDTDYVLVPEEKLSVATRALQNEGFIVE